jgi:hypothetical protein
MHTKLLPGKLKGTDHAEDVGVCGKIILEWILGKNRVGTCQLDSRVSGEGPVTGSCGQDNEPSGSIKGGEFHD